MEVSFSVLLIGLPATGKTTLIRSMTSNLQEIFPTAGFNISYVSSGIKPILVYDCSGEGGAQKNWNILLENCETVIYVIDSYKTSEFSIAKDTLFRFLTENKSMKYIRTKIEINLYALCLINQILKKGRANRFCLRPCRLKKFRRMSTNSMLKKQVASRRTVLKSALIGSPRTMQYDNLNSLVSFNHSWKLLLKKLKFIYLFLDGVFLS